jgi:hypothetical protein
MSTVKERKRRLSDHEIHTMLKTGKHLPRWVKGEGTSSWSRGKQVDGEPLTEEERADLEKKMAKRTGKIRVVHTCVKPSLTRSVEVKKNGWIPGMERLVVDFRTKASVPRAVKRTIVKSTDRKENWWHKFPEVFKCDVCDFEITREEIASTYFIHTVGGK